MKVQFLTQMRWRDPRLSYKNLREDKGDTFHLFRNRVSNEVAEEIRYPKIIFLNTDKRTKIKVTNCYLQIF